MRRSGHKGKLIKEEANMGHKGLSCELLFLESKLRSQNFYHIFVKIEEIKP
jgi:hypothetical protein